MATANPSWDQIDHPTLRAVDALDALVLRNVAEGIRARRLAPEVHGAFRRLGEYAMLVPEEAGGAAALHEEHPLQRAARAAQAVVQHGFFGHGPHEAFGRRLVARRMAPREPIDA